MISTSPLVPDPHEEAHVQLGLSLIPGAGQGLSQKTDTKIINNFTIFEKKSVNCDSFNFFINDANHSYDQMLEGTKKKIHKTCKSENESLPSAIKRQPCHICDILQLWDLYTF